MSFSFYLTVRLQDR